jgi:hypothetical protein
VLLGNGDGTFQAPLFFHTGFANVTDLQIGDFNGDGVPDLVAVAGGFNLAQANLLLGVGDGTFEAPRQILFHPNSFSDTAALGDFNGDGNLDVALTEAAGDHSQVTVVPGHGDGTFSDPVGYATHSPNTTRRSVVAADLEGTGVLDLAVTGIGGVDVLRGNGDGTFGKATLNPFSPGVGTLVVTDLNQDGAPDFITTPFSLSGEGTLLLGNGDGTFQPPERYEAGDQHIGLAVADFNGDGFPDLAVVGQDGRVFILINQADWGTAPTGRAARSGHSGIGLISAFLPGMTAQPAQVPQTGAGTEKARVDRHEKNSVPGLTTELGAKGSLSSGQSQPAVLLPMGTRRSLPILLDPDHSMMMDYFWDDAPGVF